MVPSRPPNLQKTKEKLKNPQQPNTQVLESQEGLKPVRHAVSLCEASESLLESQEGLKLKVDLYETNHMNRLIPGRISRRVETRHAAGGGVASADVTSRISRNVETVSTIPSNPERPSPRSRGAGCRVLRLWPQAGVALADAEAQRRRRSTPAPLLPVSLALS